MRTRSTGVVVWLRLTTVFLYSWGIYGTLGAQVNITIDDADPMIQYNPPTSWHSSSVACSSCLSPDSRDAYQGTYHEGTHLSLTTPTMAATSTTSMTSTTPTPTMPTTPATPSTPQDEDDSGGGKGKGGGDGDGGGGGGGDDDRRARNRHLVQREGVLGGIRIKDMSVTTQINFTGSAVYLYCIQPLGIQSTDATSTVTNLSFTLDGNLVGNYFHDGSSQSAGYAFQVNVLAKTGLSEVPHVLRVDVGVDSVFLFDYLIYTRTASPTNDTLPASSGVDEKAKKHNIATFAGAIGGSVGVLSLISLCLAISIIRRRRLYNRRERLSQDRSSLHTNASDDSPPAVGPRNFVPKYFSGTQISSDPPPYVESVSFPEISTSSPSSVASINGATSSPMMSSVITVPASYSAHLARIRDTSYADIPPLSPPSLGGLAPLPPGVASSAYVPPLGDTKCDPQSVSLLHSRQPAGEATDGASASTKINAEYPLAPHSSRPSRS